MGFGGTEAHLRPFVDPVPVDSQWDAADCERGSVRSI